MRRKLIRVLAVILFMLVMGRIDTAYADEQEAEIVEGLAVDEDTAVPLYNNDDELTAYYIEGCNSGYVIVDEEGNVIEFSYQSSIDEIEDSDTDCFYGGPGNYYVESEDDEDVLMDINSAEEVEKDEIADFEMEEDEEDEEDGEDNSEAIESAPKKSVTITLPDGIKYSDGKTTYTTHMYNTLTLKSKATLPYHSRYFNYNYDNTCGSTAAAIFTYYYFDHISKSYIKSKKYKGGDEKSQRALVNRYKKLIKDNGNGSWYWDVKRGINKYLKSIGKGKKCKYITKANILHTVISKIADCINRKRPCIVGLKGEPRYGDHWTVGIGYATYYGVNGHSRGDVSFIKVNSGWGYSFATNVVYVNYKYVDGVIYLD